MTESDSKKPLLPIVSSTLPTTSATITSHTKLCITSIGLKLITNDIPTEFMDKHCELIRFVLVFAFRSFSQHSYDSTLERRKDNINAANFKSGDLMHKHFVRLAKEAIALGLIEIDA
jgi:hypothetical protein